MPGYHIHQLNHKLVKLNRLSYLRRVGQDGGIRVDDGGEEVLVGVAEEAEVVPYDGTPVVGACLDDFLPGIVETAPASSGVGVAAAEDDTVRLVGHTAHCVPGEALNRAIEREERSVERLDS
ncbi:hypothetical protein J5N97_011424 [Dioscorea zingiberensis]|uniref:Uncharacterized protein n=1 Tax=Dioscorea zingiberensis TaxID=325984 RepID=A0A9D5D262_9LILI|nr:hypothetical protein J5N97_011424 [Dioscorea zingiberensis]